MTALALTDERWTGLPLLACHMDPGLYRIEVGTSMLVIRSDLGTNVEVLNRSGGCVVFRQAALRFDLFAAGLMMNATSDRPATKSHVVALPTDWLAVDDSRPEGRIDLRPRFQFGDPPLRRLVWRLATHHQCGEPLGSTYNRAVSRSIVDRVVRLQLAGEARHPDSVGLKPEARRLVETLIESRLPDPPTVAELASKVGIGLVRFVREFKVSFEATPHQYIQQRRLTRARQLLRSTDGSLSTIALETGFASHSHFSTVFRALTGVTPSAYRRAAAGARGGQA